MGEEPRLTERETEILEQLATGASNRQIARRLHISANTVKVHLHNIYRKLGVESRTEATLLGLQAGLISGVGPGTANRGVWGPPGWVVLVLVAGLLVVAVVLSDVFTRARNQAPGTTIDLQQLEASRWEELAPMTIPRRGMAAVAFQVNIYVIAGETAEGITGVVERYDPSTDIWESLPSKPTPVADIGAAVIGGKIYVPGGRMSDGRATNALEVFDPRSGTWDVGPSMPGGLYAYAITAYEGRIYVFGGTDGDLPQAEVWIFDPETESWESGGSMKSTPTRGGGGGSLDWDTAGRWR